MARYIVAMAILLVLPSFAAAQHVVGAGGGPHVRIFSNSTGAQIGSFFAYDPNFTGGVRVASGDVTGDGTDDIITAPGPGGGPHVKVFDGSTFSVIDEFDAFDTAFTGGVFVGAAKVNDDGIADIITGAGTGGGPHVRVFDGATGADLHNFVAYEPSFTGGVRVAAGDVTGDGHADIITAAGPGGGPHVKVFDGLTGSELRSFFAFEPTFAGGVFVAAGDVNNDGAADIITGAGPGGGPHVRVFDGSTGADLFNFFPFETTFTGGVRVATGDVNNDGFDDIITGAGPGGGPRVRVFSGRTGGSIDEFDAFSPTFGGGVFVAGGVRVPEPSCLILLLMGLMPLTAGRSTSRSV